MPGGGGKNEDVRIYLRSHWRYVYGLFGIFVGLLGIIGYIVLMGDLLTQLIPPIFPSDEWLNRVAMMGSCVVVIYR